MSKTIAVIFGGVSNENEISVITGTMSANVLKSGGDRVIPVYISADGNFYTGEELLSVSSFKGGDFSRFSGAVIANGGVYILNRRGRVKKFIAVDAALNCCHGGAGEGGAVSGLCSLAKIPLAGAGMFESALFIDKYLTKLALKALGVTNVEYTYIKSLGELKKAKITFPVIVKPVSLGSSIGVEKAEDMPSLERAAESALLYDGAVIVEKYIEERREINCAAYFADGRIITSECEEAFTGGDILSFEDKYEGGGRSVLPADIPEKISSKIKKTTELVYGRLNMRGIVRFDYILCGETVYLSEVNTVPGSLAYYLLSGGFKDFYKVLNAVVDQAVADCKAFAARPVLHTGILDNIPSNITKLGIK